MTLLQSQNAFCSCSKYSAMAWQELQPMLSHTIPANIVECSDAMECSDEVSYRDLKAHSSWFYFCTWYNYIPNFFLTLHSISKPSCELHSSLSQLLCHVLHVATFLLSCCQSNINTTLPFLPLLPAPCVLSAPQERRGLEEAI